MVSNIPNLHQIIESKNEGEEEKPNIKILTFKDYVYLCGKDEKEIYYFQMSEKVLYFLTPYNKKIVHKILIEDVEKILIPNSNNFLFQVTSKSVNYLVESPYTDEIIQCLIQNPNFNQKIDLIDYFEIENNMFFISSSIKIFNKPHLQGFVKIWVNNLFYNWSLYYLILIDNLLIKV